MSVRIGGAQPRDDGRAARPGAIRVPAGTAAPAVTIALAAVCWIVALRRMSGMDMGVETSLGSLAFFLGAWVPMMAAMMLPGAAAAVARAVRADARLAAMPRFVLGYLAIWTVAGLAVYALYRPHGTAVAGAVTLAAGAYELTPLKRGFRRRCLRSGRSGVVFGADCAGSSAGLMAMLLALGAMSATWMITIALVALAQKLLPERSAPDVALGIAIVAFGVVILLAPGAVPGLTPSM